MRAEELNAVVAIEKSKTGAMFMSSSAGELFDHLHSIKSKESSLSWELRLKIAAETAGALAYLHSSTSMPIIHQDVNIISTKLLRHTRNEIHSKQTQHIQNPGRLTFLGWNSKKRFNMKMVSTIYEISKLQISGKASNLPTQSNLFIFKSHKNRLDQNAQPVHYSEIMITYLEIKFEIEIQEKHTT